MTGLHTTGITGIRIMGSQLALIVSRGCLVISINRPDYEQKRKSCGHCCHKIYSWRSSILCSQILALTGSGARGSHVDHAFCIISCRRTHNECSIAYQSHVSKLRNQKTAESDTVAMTALVDGQCYRHVPESATE